MTKTVITQGRVVDPANNTDQVQDIYIAEGNIVSLGQKPADFSHDKLINAKDFIVCPGLVDLSARPYMPGQPIDDSLKHEMNAAAQCGITTLACPPDTFPTIINDHIMLEWITHCANQAGNAQLYPLGALTYALKGEQLNELSSLKKAGCIAISNSTNPILDTQIKRQCFEYAATIGMPLFIYPQDFWLSKNGYIHEGEVSMHLGLKGIPEIAETIAIAENLLLIEETGIKAHFYHLSTAKSVTLIEEAIKKGLPVTADVTAHHLYLTEIDVDDFNTMCYVNPPLRNEQDRQALQYGIVKNYINSVSSDHTPLSIASKQKPFAESTPGISGFDTLLPLTLQLSELNDLTLSQVLSLITINPANALGVNAGTLSIGTSADICIFDPKKEWRLTKNNFSSQGINSPFIDRNLKGKVQYTIKNGKIVFAES